MTFTLDVQRCDFNDVATDLTGYTAEFTIWNMPDALFTDTVILGTTDSNGWIHISQLANWTPEKYEYSLDLTAPNATIERLFFGALSVRKP